MKYSILSTQIALQEYVDDKRLTEPQLNEVWQFNKCHVSEFDN